MVFILSNLKSPLSPPSFGEIGYITFKRTYARLLNKSSNETEEWDQTLARIVRSCEEQLSCGFTPEEEEELFYLLYYLKCSVAGRFLWQLGTDTVSRIGLASLQNCAFRIIDSPVEPFTWAFDMLMLGSGVGVNIQQQYIQKIPPVKKVQIERKDTKDADFIVPDSREGWTKLLGKVLKAHFYSGKGFNYSTILLRSKGAPIKSFGGVASGPEVLCNGIRLINDVLNKCVDFHNGILRPIDALDILNIEGMIVVSGNVRRSAIIAIGDATDIEFLKAKRWDIGNIPNWRSMSNNSVVCENIRDLPPEFWEGYVGNGEPYGLINLKLLQSCGRLGEKMYDDPNVKGTNPCGEQGLENGETCCLSDIFLPNITSFDELMRCAIYMYRVCKHSLNLPCHHPLTEEVVHRNQRMGIGVTGYLQATEAQKSWLSECYERLREYDISYSKSHNWPRSIKLTTCKPSGTLSLLPGVTPGVHPGFSRYFIRRVRFSSNSPLISLCREHGYSVEPQINFDGSLDHNTVVVSFPCSFPEHTVFAQDCSAIKQLEYVKKIQSEWSDNSVSVTVYYALSELPLIRKWLRANYKENIKSVSFLLRSEHGFKQAPYEEISKSQYLKLKAQTRPIYSSKGIGSSKEDEKYINESECDGDKCPLR